MNFVPYLVESVMTMEGYCFYKILVNNLFTKRWECLSIASWPLLFQATLPGVVV